MQLDDFLNSRRIASLQVLQWHWAPATRRSASKAELLRILRRRMLAPDTVRRQFESLEPPAQELLRALLRCDGYEGDAAVRLRRLPHAPATPHAGRQLVEDLARRGFLAIAPRGAQGARDGLWVVVPQELGHTLADVLNLDIRDAAAMLSLRRFLAGLSPADRQRLAGADLPPDALVERLARPEAVEQRLAALPSEPLRRAARLALESHAGILPLERFPSLGLDIETVDSPRWRAALEGALLGTFGHLSLLDRGLGDDHDCLVLYQEIVEAHAAARAVRQPAFDHTYACGIDFLTDVLALVDFLRANPSKLTAAGRFFKGARNQLLPLSALRSTFFMDEDSLLGFKAAVARELGLAEPRDDGRIHAAPNAAAWQARPLAAQARELLDALLRLAEASCPPRHFRAMAAAALGLLRESAPGEWYPAGAFVARVLSRCLLAEGTPAGGDGDDAAHPDLTWPPRTRPQPTVGELAAAAREPLLHALNCAGVLDIGRQGERHFVAASQLAPVVLGQAALAAADRPLILVNPDGEIMLFPEEGHLELLHRLCAFCERGRSEVTIHLHVTSGSVQRAVLRGLTPDEIIATLARHNRATLPQNIEYSVRSWAAGVHPARICTMHVLELDSPQALDAAVHLPQVAPLVVRRLSPTAVALRAPALGPEAEAALRQVGVYLM